VAFRQHWKLGLLLFFVIAGGLFLSKAHWPERYRNAFKNGLQERNIYIRLENYCFGANIIRDAPWLGIGPRTLAFHTPCKAELTTLNALRNKIDQLNEEKQELSKLHRAASRRKDAESSKRSTTLTAQIRDKHSKALAIEAVRHDKERGGHIHAWLKDYQPRLANSEERKELYKKEIAHCRTLDSTFLTIACEHGLPASLAFLVFWILLIGACVYKHYRDPASAEWLTGLTTSLSFALLAFLGAMFDHDGHVWPHINVMASLTAGALAISSNTGKIKIGCDTTPTARNATDMKSQGSWT